jgi:hypothetical protein
LQAHDDTAEKPDENDDRQGAHADDVHLNKDVVGVVRTTENVAERARPEEEKLLKCLYPRFQKIEQAASPNNNDDNVDANMRR